MRPVVITEGKTDSTLLEAILANAVPPDTYDLLTAGGASPAVSLARTILATTPRRVALIIDGDFPPGATAVDPDPDIELSLRLVSDPSRFLLAVIRPEFEAILFKDLEWFDAVFQIPLTLEDRVEARYNPKAILKKVLKKASLGGTGPSLLLPQFLHGKDLTPLARQEPFPKLIEFLRAPAQS